MLWLEWSVSFRGKLAWELGQFCWCTWSLQFRSQRGMRSIISYNTFVLLCWMKSIDSIENQTMKCISLIVMCKVIVLSVHLSSYYRMENLLFWGKETHPFLNWLLQNEKYKTNDYCIFRCNQLWRIFESFE